MSELKPCPFCGIEIVDGHVHEPTCYFKLDFNDPPDMFEISKAWNTRPESKLIEAVEGMAIKQLRVGQIDGMVEFIKRDDVIALIKGME